MPLKHIPQPEYKRHPEYNYKDGVAKCIHPKVKGKKAVKQMKRMRQHLRELQNKHNGANNE